MVRRVKSKVNHMKSSKWREFLTDLKQRLVFHEQRVGELRPLIAELEEARADGMEFPDAHRKIGGAHSATRN